MVRGENGGLTGDETHDCPDLHTAWSDKTEIGWTESRFILVKCTFAYLLDGPNLEVELNRPKPKLSLIRFFDNNEESRNTHDTWNQISESFSQFHIYAEKEE